MEPGKGGRTSAYGFASLMLKPSAGVAAAYLAAAEADPTFPFNCLVEA